MNDRILLLVEQAMVTTPVAEGPLSHTWFDREKFAKLIIQDCISQTALVGIGNFNNLDIVWAVDASIDNIQRHFGIVPE
jgi:hypothetical protein